MSLQAPRESGHPIAPHLGELRLRRLRAGELAGAEADETHRHLEGCPACRERLEVLAAEDRAFAAAIPFPRFAGGVERAARVPRSRPVSRRATFAGAGLGLVAAAAGLLLFLRGTSLPTGEMDPGNRIKGDAVGTLHLRGAAGAQRALEPGSTTRLQAGDALLLGYRMPAGGHLVALSIDDAGQVTVLHESETPASLSLQHLPESFVLTGSGRERVYLVLSRQRLPASAVSAGARYAHRDASGDLRAMPPLLLSDRPGVSTTTWLFEKP